MRIDLPKKIFAAVSIITISMMSTACLNKAETLAPEPSLIDQDTSSPSCTGITSLTVSAGPALTVVWTQAADNLTQASNITYNIYMRKNAESYDLVSPAKIVVGATSTIVSNGVSVGNTYTLFVTCSDEKGNTYPVGPQNEQAIAVNDTQPPSQITNLSAGSATFTTILLTWSPSDDGAGGTTAGNMSYKVFAALTTPVSTAGSPLTTVTSGGTSYLDSGLDPATTYYYKVVAVDASNNNSTDSNEASATTVTDTTPPTFSGNSAAIAIGSVTTGTISLSWSAASDNVTATGSLSYRVYRCSGLTTCDPFSGTLVTTKTLGTILHVDSGLTSSTVYVYGIRAVDSTGNVSTNTDTKITSTTYSSSGSFYAYPTVEEVNIRLGISVAIGNVIGAATGGTAYPDLIVGAPNASEAGSSYRLTGCVYVFAGTGVGAFSSTPSYVFCQPNAITNGGQNGLNFGTALATGDFDGDGITDIVVTNPARFTAYIFRTQNSAGTLSIGTTATPISHPTSNTTFGTGICVGNSDNVGADDLFISTTSETCSVACGRTGTGNLLVFNNVSTAGTFIAPGSVSYYISPTANVMADLYNISNNEVVVRSCTLGNFDPTLPAQTQLVIGSGTVSYTGAGATDGIVTFYRKTAADTFVYQNVLPGATPSVTANNWGQSVAAIQLGSGTKSLLVGAPLDDNVGTDAGSVFLYAVTVSGGDFVLTDTGQSFYGGTDFDNNGAGIAVAAGDIWNHGDGTQDMVLGAYLDDGTMTLGANQINLGQVFTYHNIGGTLGPTAQQASFDTSSNRVRSYQLFGWAMCKGDVNNDGLTDVVIGSPYTNYDVTTLTTNTNVGSVNVYYGVANGEIDFVNPSQTIYAPGAQNSSFFGMSCVVMDYNGDGYQDLLVGSPYRDVNQTDRGAVYIYFGANNTPLPSSNSNVLNNPSSTASEYFGYSMTTGDLDGNGYDDLAVGAIGVNSGAGNSGRVFVYWADDTTQAITSVGTVTISPPSGAFNSVGNTYLANTQTLNANEYFGRAIQTFPTVGSSSGIDLVVCTLGADVVANYHYAGSGAPVDIGNCWIYEGKVNGGIGGGSYQMMTMPKNEIRYPQGYSTPANSIYFGAGITKGDWSADGVDDLIICASRQTNLITTDTSAGGCFAYYGVATGGFSSFTGYKPNATNTATTRFAPAPDDYHYNPNPEPSTGSRWGEAVLLLDINNNSTLDLLVGEPYSDNPTGQPALGADSGRVYILRGGY